MYAAGGNRLNSLQQFPEVVPSIQTLWVSGNWVGLDQHWLVLAAPPWPLFYCVPVQWGMLIGTG